MADQIVRSPRTAYATRSAESKPNIAYPDEAVPVAGEEERAAVELAQGGVVPDAEAVGLAAFNAVDAADVDIEDVRADVLADVDAALTGAGASGAEKTAAADAINAVFDSPTLFNEIDATACQAAAGAAAEAAVAASASINVER